MRKCMIEGCTKQSHYNPITGESNILCLNHLKQVQKPKVEKQKNSNSQRTTFNKPLKKSVDKSKPTNKQKNYNQTGKLSVQLFVLRGHTLTINYTGKTKHVNVNRLTRAVKYNADKEGTSGKMFHYIIDLKQGIEVVANILFDNKAEREREFAKLQAMLSKL